MKIELDKITLGHSPLSDKIHAGIVTKKGNLWLYKKDVTQQFIDCVIKRWENQEETIHAGENQWKITVKKIK